MRWWKNLINRLRCEARRRYLHELGKETAYDYHHLAQSLLRDMPEEEFQNSLSMLKSLLQTDADARRESGLLLDYINLMINALPPERARRAKEIIVIVMKTTT